MPRQCELVAAHHLAGQIGQVLDVRLVAGDPAEQVVEVVVVLPDRQRAEISVDLARFEEGSHALHEGGRNRRCLRRGRGGDGGHAAGPHSTPTLLYSTLTGGSRFS